MSVTRSLGIIEPADVRRLTWEDKAAALVEGTRTLHSLMHGTVCPVVMGQIDKSAIERAIVLTYERITLLLDGIAALKDPAHFQIANSVARTVFELVLDLKAFRSDPSLAAKFFAFTDVVKFRKAEQLVTFLDGNTTIDRSPHQHAITFASDAQRKRQVEQQCIQHWGANKSQQPNWPDHWSGKSTAERARHAGLEFEEMYRSQYFLQSQYVHSGLAGIQNLSRNALICSFAIAHALIQRLAATATELIGDQFHLFNTNLELRDRLLAASSASRFYALETVLRQRVEVLES